MRTLGANRKLIKTAYLIEFSLLGLLSGLLAVMISEILVYALYVFVLHIDYQINSGLWLLVPIISTFSVAIAGYCGVRGVLNKSPVQVFREL